VVGLEWYPCCRLLQAEACNTVGLLFFNYNGSKLGQWEVTSDSC